MTMISITSMVLWQLPEIDISYFILQVRFHKRANFPLLSNLTRGLWTRSNAYKSLRSGVIVK